MIKHALDRIEALLAQGQTFGRGRGEDYWASDVAAAQAWMASAANIVHQSTPATSFYRAEIDRLTTHEQLKGGIPVHVLQKVLGLLSSVREEASHGLLERLEYQVFATAFDDFLDHAGGFHKSGKIKEAAVLGSAVLEDTVKRIALKSGIAADEISLDPLIDELTKAGIFTAVKAKRVKAYAGVRNASLHAEWDKLDPKSVNDMIDGVRDLLDTYLQ